MANLFIIRNGFDLNHSLPTHYDHFREFLRTTYKYAYEEEPFDLPEGNTDPSGGVVYDEDMVAHYLDYLISMASDYET